MSRLYNVLNEMRKKTVYRKRFSFSPPSFSAGTPGTYASLDSTNIAVSGYTPIMAVVGNNPNPGAVLAGASFSGSTGYIYYYRATASAFSGSNNFAIDVLYVPSA